MSDDAQTPAARDPWAAPSEASSRDAAPRVPLAKPDDSAAEPNPWAPPTSDAQAGSGYTMVGSDLPTADAGSAPPRPAHPSVHDQQTVTSMPGVGDTPPPSQPWANPFAPPVNGPTTPFTPPPHSHGEPVPPPPIAPEGPGRISYGHGYGYGPPAGPQAPGPGAAGYYGWPGTAPLPSNGMGTAALVIGIIAAVVFCLWPIAIVLGVLAVIFGFIGRAKARRGEATNPGQALAGIICGIAGLVLGAAMIAILIAT